MGLGLILQHLSSKHTETHIPFWERAPRWCLRWSCSGPRLRPSPGPWRAGGAWRAAAASPTRASSTDRAHVGSACYPGKLIRIDILMKRTFYVYKMIFIGLSILCEALNVQTKMDFASVPSFWKCTMFAQFKIPISTLPLQSPLFTLY
jgi:hypothetical protein